MMNVEYDNGALKAIMLKRLGGKITVTLEELQDISGEVTTIPDIASNSYKIEFKEAPNDNRE